MDKEEAALLVTLKYGAPVATTEYVDSLPEYVLIRLTSDFDMIPHFVKDHIRTRLYHFPDFRKVVNNLLIEYHQKEE